MAFLIISVFLAIVSGIYFIRYNLNQREGRHTDSGCVWAEASVFVLAIGFVVSTTEMYNQINDFEDIKKFEKVGAIYRVKAEALTFEFTKHLADEYPKHERDIYEKIGPDQVTLYVVKYPELKASETLMALVEQINKLQSDVYDQQVKSEEALQRTRVRLRNPWNLRFIIPTE